MSPFYLRVGESARLTTGSIRMSRLARGSNHFESSTYRIQLMLLKLKSLKLDIIFEK